jgi:hypothetical protein
MGHARKPGKVATIRINPTECLQIIDFLERSGIEPSGRSFSTCVGIVVHALLKDAHQRGFMQDVDGFQYNNKMAQFLPPEELAVSTLQTPVKEVKQEDPQEIEKAQDRLQELVDLEDSIGLTAEEKEEKYNLMKLVFN